MYVQKRKQREALPDHWRVSLDTADFIDSLTAETDFTVAWLFEVLWQRLGGHFLCQTLLNSGRLAKALLAPPVIQPAVSPVSSSPSLAPPAEPEIGAGYETSESDIFGVNDTAAPFGSRTDGGGTGSSGGSSGGGTAIAITTANAGEGDGVRLGVEEGTGVGERGSVMWHTYTMPVSGRVVASWFHTHAYVASEMWVVSGDVESAIPRDIVDRAKANGRISDEYLNPPLLFAGARGEEFFE